MRFLLIGLILAAGVEIHAQTLKKTHPLPASVKASDYQKGKVLVKVKEKFKSEFQGASVLRSNALLKGSSMKSIAKGPNSNKAARNAPFKPKIDISRYFEISFDPSRPVEEVINELYASGYVELAEPSYKVRMLVTPNDANINFQYYLTNIKAFQAWDIEQGSEDMVIGIVDSGVDIDHPDLADQLYINTGDPVNGIDDDNNGYIDDYRGWDFSGADTLNAFNPNFVGDNDPSIPKAGGGFGHGTQVGGCASASTNNGTGIAGVGYNTRLLYTKHFADNQPSSAVSYSSNLYLGVIYAAENGAKIINCSWGSTVRSQVYQDIITYVTLDLGCLVVSAAGNSGNGTSLYPASYDYVLSVAATDADDKQAWFSNYGSKVDLSAPGVSIYTTSYNNLYSSPDGTSLSAPIVSGAAALVWSHFPNYTPLQVAEQLRVTADENFTLLNPSLEHQFGKGRLDVYAALTTSSPSIRALEYELVNASGSVAGPGDEAFLYLDFFNYLESTSGGLEISISTTSTAITITKDKISPGVIASGATLTNRLTPFELTLNSSIPENVVIDLLITYSDGAYQDFQLFSLIPNPSYRDVDDNLITATVTSAGRLGYEDTGANTKGSGFVYKDASILFEMGLIMGNSPSSLLNTVRASGNTYDQDFVSTERIREITPGERSYSEIFGEFSNSTTAANQKVKVAYRSLVWRDSVRSKFVIMEYKIKNPQAVPVTDFYFGLFSDWDISFNGAEDAAQWNASLQLGYVFPKLSTSLPHAGIQLLTNNAHYYAIDNDPNVSGNPFGLYDGFTYAEKFTSISTIRLSAGNGSAVGGDVSHVVSSGPHTINPDEEIIIAFALHAADNLTDLINSAKYADSVYNFTLQAPRPVIDTVNTCYGTGATLVATGASQFNWYDSFTGGNLLASGSPLNVTNVVSDTTLYVSNADESYESVRTPAHIRAMAQPGIVTSRSPILCDGDVVTLSVAPSTEYLWSTGETTQSIDVSSAGDYHVEVTFDDGVLNCFSTSDVVTVTSLSRPEAAFSFLATPEDNTVYFVDESTDAAEWFWDFGDGESSEEQNPTHTFNQGGLIDVHLVVTGANGCQDNVVQTVSVVLAAEEELQRLVQIFPVPAPGDEVTVAVDGVASQHVVMTLMNALGSKVIETRLESPPASFAEKLNIRTLRSGIYFLRVQFDNKTITKKLIVNR